MYQPGGRQKYFIHGEKRYAAFVVDALSRTRRYLRRRTFRTATQAEEYQARAAMRYTRLAAAIASTLCEHGHRPGECLVQACKNHAPETVPA